MRIIFHHPLPIKEDGTSASEIRPKMLIDAFLALGIEVHLATGYARERKASIEKIIANIKDGLTYDLLYSESSTMPTLLTEPHHLPTHPFMDFGLFSIANKKKIPVALFYRDIYWQFENSKTSFLKQRVAKFFYKYDLLKYHKYLDILYLPSLQMAPSIPGEKFTNIKELPPGCAPQRDQGSSLDIKPTYDGIRPLEIFYVGGMSAHYEMQELFRAVQALENVRLTVCTRQEEWAEVKSQYERYLNPRINIIHNSGAALTEHFQKADLFSLFVKPKEYREFAVPFKLYEYIGYGNPIIASQKTLAGNTVKKQALGWTIEYSYLALQKLLIEIQNNPHILQFKQKEIKAIGAQESWRARAQQIIHDAQKIII